ncbi:hypothetical protein LXL04_012277 [Taraxacum kok-saghyz]
MSDLVRSPRCLVGAFDVGLGPDSLRLDPLSCGCERDVFAKDDDVDESLDKDHAHEAEIRAAKGSRDPSCRGEPRPSPVEERGRAHSKDKVFGTSSKGMKYYTRNNGCHDESKYNGLDIIIDHGMTLPKEE